VTSSSSDGVALWEQRGHTGIITLNRPKAMNAINSELSTAVGGLLAAADENPQIRVVVVTGAGRAFCAGADLKALATGRGVAAEEHPEWGFGGYVRHWISKPTVAAVNGFALGGGTELVLASDLAVLDESATLGLPEVKRGLFASAGGVIRLAQQIPKKRALELALTGDSLSAADAWALGLVNRVAPAGTALAVALNIAETIAANAPVAVRETKSMIHRSVALPDWDDAAWEANSRAKELVLTSADAKEGPRAFAEKRLPQWLGR
jgi:enoyl-CoA hydratase/carnithine racemase